MQLLSSAPCNFRLTYQFYSLLLYFRTYLSVPSTEKYYYEDEKTTAVFVKCRPNWEIQTMIYSQIHRELKCVSLRMCKIVCLSE